MTVLNFSFNDLAARAESIAVTVGSENALHPAENLFNGGSGLYFASNAAVTATRIVLDLGSGNTGQIDHAIIRGVNLFLQNTTGTRRIKILASTDNFSASNVTILDSGDFTDGSAFVGTQGDDLVLTGSLSSSYRYWALDLASGSGFHYLRKCYIGQFFNFEGRSPSYPYSKNYDIPNIAIRADGGPVFSSSRGYPATALNLGYVHISDALRAEFEEKIGKYKNDYFVFLYAPDSFDHKVLDTYKVIFGKILTSQFTAQQWKDHNALSIEFLEDVIG